MALSFHPRTLAQLLYVRSTLQLDDRVDRFLAAAITGILHGKSATYLSEVMPNTFSMAPRYVRDFVARTGFRSPDRDVFACLEAKLGRLYREPLPRVRGIALLGDARDAGERTRIALRERGLPDRARLVVTSPPYLRVVKYGYYNWLRTWFLGFDAAAIDAALDDAHHKTAYLRFLGDVLEGLRPALADDAVVVLVIGDVEADRGRRISNGVGLAEAVWESAAAPAGYRLAGIALDDVHAGRKMTKLWGDEAGQATKLDRILVLGATEAGRRRAVNGAALPVDWEWPPAVCAPSRGPAGQRPSRIAAMQQMYDPPDLAAMDPLVLMKNLDHVRMTSRRLSYILQQQVHLYAPEANELRDQIDRYVEAERQIEGEMARRRIRA